MIRISEDTSTAPYILQATISPLNKVADYRYRVDYLDGTYKLCCSPFIQIAYKEREDITSKLDLNQFSKFSW